MTSVQVIVEQSRPDGLLVGHVVGVPGAFSQAETLDELQDNLVEVLELMREVGAVQLDFGSVRQAVSEGFRQVPDLGSGQPGD